MLVIFSTATNLLQCTFYVFNFFLDVIFRRRRVGQTYIGYYIKWWVNLLCWSLHIYYTRELKKHWLQRRLGIPKADGREKPEAPVNYASSGATSAAISYTSESPCSYLTQPARHPLQMYTEKVKRPQTDTVLNLRIFSLQSVLFKVYFIKWWLCMCNSRNA